MLVKEAVVIATKITATLIITKLLSARHYDINSTQICLEKNKDAFSFKDARIGGHM